MVVDFNFDEKMDEAMREIEANIRKEIKNFSTNRHLKVEISIAWDDEEEFEHEGYYRTIDDAIDALISLKEMEKNN